MSAWTPRPMQIPMLEHLLQHRRAALYARPGSGKSVVTLTAIDRLSLIEDVYPALVIAPKRVAKGVWPVEAQKWEHLSHIRISAVVGTESQRVLALATNADVFTTNYECIPWLVSFFGEKWPFKTVVADECVKLKSFRLRQGGKRAQALAKVAFRSPRWINLTGTPTPNGLIDLYGPQYFIDRGERLGRTFSAFSERWFYPHPSGYGILPHAHSAAEIQAKLKDICLTIDPRDYYDLKAPIVTDIHVELPPDARRVYRDMEKKFFAQINGHDVEAFHAGAKSQKLLQCCAGAIYVSDDGAWEEVHTEKLDALDDIIEECAGAPVIVAYQFRSDLERLQKRYPAAAVLATEKGLAAFKTGRVLVGLAHPASLGHGVDGLQNVCDTLIYFSLNWGMEEHEQILERIGPMRQLQAGLDRNVFVYRILARGTLDEAVLDRLAGKSSVQESLMNYMKRTAT